MNLLLSVANLLTVACASGTADQPRGTAPSVGLHPGEPATPAAPTTSTPGEDAAHTQDFLAHVAPILTAAQQQIYTLQAPFSTFAPEAFPAPEWAQFYDDEARVARDALRQLRDLAPTAPDPDAFLAALDAWDSGMVRRLDDLAAAARLADGGEQFAAVHGHGVSTDPLHEYMVTFLAADIVPPYMGPVIIMFGPDAGR